MASDVRGAAEDELFARKDIAFDRAVDFGDRDFDDRFRHLRAGADDERPVLRGDVT